MAANVEIDLLGTFAVRVDGRTLAVDGWGHRRAADLVALLALAPRHRLLRDQVLEALWPGLSPEAGAANLHKAAHHARRALDDAAAVVLRSGVVALFPDAEVATDVDRFERAARRAVAADDRVLCAAAADLHPGDLLPDRRYDEWTAARREQLCRDHLDLLRRAGRWAEVVARERTDEAAHRELMRAAVRAGEPHTAVRWFQRLRAALARELGVRPSAETLTLHRDVVAALGRATAGPHVPLVGRDVALARLRAGLRGPRRPVLLVTGEAGIGKSRLCATFCAEARDVGLDVLCAAGDHDARPFAVARAAARSAAPDRLDGLPAEAREALADATGPASRQQLLGALVAVCRGARTGTLLFVDDAHLADDDSVALLAAPAADPAARCTLLLAIRPEEVRPPLAALRARTAAIEVALPPLSRDESDEVVVAVCGGPPGADVLDRVWRLGAGNPFFTTELASAVGGAGGLPATLDAAVAARLARCGPELVELLRRVAVVEGPVDVDEFAALCGLDPDAASAALDRALAAGVLVVEGEGYRFRHALVACRLAAEVPPHRLRAIHAAAAGTLAARGGRPGRVAAHLDAAGRSREAVPWHVEAARAAGAAGAYAVALGHVEAALAAVPGRADLLALRADLRYASGDRSAPAAYGEAATAATGARRDELRLRQAWALLMAGDLRAAAEATAGVAAGESTRLRRELIAGLIAWFTGRLAQAERAAAETTRLALAAGDTADLLDSALLRALVAHSRGRWTEQLELDLLDPRNARVLAGMLSDAHLCVGELYLYGERARGEVVEFAVRLHATATAAGAARGAAFAMTLLGEAELLAGDLDAAEDHLLDGARAHRAVGARGGEAIALHALAELALARGNPAAAGRLLDEAHEAARFSPLSARHLLTRIYGTRLRAAPDDPAALAVLDEAQANLVRPAEACPLCWVPYLLPAATVLARVGRPDAAEPLLGMAQELVGVLWAGRGRWAGALAEARTVVAAARA